MGMGQVVDYSEFILQIEKAIANGIATLDSNAKVPKNQIDLVASDVGAIASESDPTVQAFTKGLTSNNSILSALNAASGTISNTVLPNEIAALQLLADTTGFLRKTGDGSYSIDAASYLNLTGGTVTGAANFSNSTASTSTTTGGVIFGGGIGVAGAIFANTVSANSYNLIPIGRGGGSVSSNTVIGTTALAVNTTGSNLAAFGLNALRYNTTGIGSCGFGTNALINNTTGNNSLAFGTNAGRFIADGSTNLTIANNCCFLGNSTKALADNAINENVIGNNATGNGNNTVTIGDSNITNNFFTGVISLGGNQVLTTRRTGWSAATGTATRTTFATSTVTLPQLAERVKALTDDLITHGLIGA